jgi:hypothetical protein
MSGFDRVQSTTRTAGRQERIHLDVLEASASLIRILLHFAGAALGCEQCEDPLIAPKSDRDFVFPSTVLDAVYWPGEEEDFWGGDGDAVVVPDSVLP